MKSRLLIFWFFLIICFGILVFRLFLVSIIQGRYNRELADGQRIRFRKITAPRGIIYDRKREPLVRDVPVFKKCSSPAGEKKAECEIISREEALSLEAQNREADFVIDVGRQYPYGESMAHLLGYLGEVTKEEIENKKCPEGRKYNLGDFIGRTGIEEEYECVLRGIDGAELLEVDTEGKTIRMIGKRESVPGSDVILAIDSGLQVAAYNELKGKRGAIISQNPASGEVLLLVSSSSFNPQDITEEVLTDSQTPLLNRAISGVYPPGSTFKIVTAATGLEEEKINGQTIIEDHGVITIGPYHYANWYFTQYGKTEGPINLVRAIKRSTDTFFYKVGEFVGAEKLVEWGSKFGLGKMSGIDIPSEAAGFLPNPHLGGWYLGNTYHLAIGQGNLGLTPLQVNTMTSIIASGGKLCQPHIRVKEPFDFAQGKQESERVKECYEVGLKQETIKLITEGMREACSPGGTAFPLFDFKIINHKSEIINIPVACKTGTAEFGDPKGKTHAWLTAFVLPSEALAKEGRDQIAITVLVEGGGEGSRVAAPIVKKVLEAYFNW